MTINIIHGDARSTGLLDKHYHACITSPPYFGLREYGDDDREIGDESTPEEYVSEMVAVGREVRRVLRDDGTWWLNLGDSYNSSPSNQQSGASFDRPSREGAFRTAGRRKRDGGDVPAKGLIGIPWRVALALQADGWILRAAIPWIKANPMPESVRDRPTVAHEYVFLLSKQARYFWDVDAVRAPNAIKTVQDKRIGTERIADFEQAGDDYGRGTSASRRLARNATGGTNGRNLRTSDFFHAGIDAINDFAKHARDVRENGGLLLSPDGDPLAFLVNPAGSKLAHFAMWPPRLVAPMIKASTSENGCCPACGAPWTRTVDRQPGIHGVSKRASKFIQEGGAHTSTLGHGGKLHGASRTLGFRQSCACPPANPVPCRVVDIFAGSGTTAQVARVLGRDCDLVELMAKNLPIIEQRLRDELDPETMKPVKRTVHRRTPSQIKLLNDESPPAPATP